MSFELNQTISILNPGTDAHITKISPTVWHDLGMDEIIPLLTSSKSEQTMIYSTMANMIDNPQVSAYRQDVFEDLFNNPLLCDKITKLLEQIDNLQEYMSMKREIDKKDSVWTLMRRLKEISDYIQCIEAMQLCLSEADIRSEGLIALKNYIEQIYNNSGFTELKLDIDNLRNVTSQVKSVTLGINLNENYEAESMGIVSLNNQRFTDSHIISNFTKIISQRDEIANSVEWKHNYTYNQAQSAKNNNAGLNFVERTSRLFTAAANPLMGVGLGLSRVHSQEPERDVLEYMDQVVNHMIASSVKAIKNTLAKYATVSIYSITGLIPEFVYYIRWADYIRKLKNNGYSFCKASVAYDDLHQMNAKGFYNLKLASLANMNPADIVVNDLSFDNEHCLYVLTGANRGGKTTITQAIGQLFIMAQGGIYVTANEFQFSPVDSIYTHFPADEDKTLDFGRLGEECSRFKEIYTASNNKSLILLNESFATTSFEEGYYIAFDAIRAILKKNTRTIYNTHIHKLGREIQDLKGAYSMIVQSENGQRSYKLVLAPPEGLSYAMDIAKKYGVTYELLTASL